MIYLDNNATTTMSVQAKQAMIEWCNKGNPSAGYASAQESRKMMTKFRELLGTICKVRVCCPEERDSIVAINRAHPLNYKVLFTSGASEASCMVIAAVITSFATARKCTPHLVISAIEHKSIYDMAATYESRGLITVTRVAPIRSGHIRPEDVQAAIQSDTCLVCVMHANGETGAINNVTAIGAISHKHGVPYLCDTVQTFGKYPPAITHIDAICVSFHKFGGPPGSGALIIKQQFLEGYKLMPMIFGTQNEGLRGGTENLPGIGASFMATKLAMESRSEKNARVHGLKKYIIMEISARMPSRAYTQQRMPPMPEVEIVFLSGIECNSNYLHNTILLSVYKYTAPPICNVRLKNDLEAKGVVVSVGSACNTASPHASHVLYAMGANELIRKGTLRISLGDENTMEHAKCFVKEFLTVITKQIKK